MNRVTTFFLLSTVFCILSPASFAASGSVCQYDVEAQAARNTSPVKDPQYSKLVLVLKWNHGSRFDRWVPAMEYSVPYSANLFARKIALNDGGAQLTVYHSEVLPISVQGKDVLPIDLTLSLQDGQFGIDQLVLMDGTVNISSQELKWKGFAQLRENDWSRPAARASTTITSRWGEVVLTIVRVCESDSTL